MREPMHESLRAIRARLEELAASVRSAHALAREALGWDRLFVKDHIARIAAQSAEAEELARKAIDEGAEVTARVGELEAEGAELAKLLPLMVAQYARLEARIAALEARPSGADHG